MQVNKRGLEFLLQASIYFIIAGTYMNKEKNSTVQDYTREMALLTEFNPSTAKMAKNSIFDPVQKFTTSPDISGLRIKSHRNEFTLT